MKKIALAGIIAGGIVLGIVLFIGLCFWIVSLDKATLIFYVNETNAPLDGTLYLDNNLLGEVKDGKISLVFSEIYPGELLLSGKWQGNNFTFYWDLSKSMLDSDSLNFYVFQEKLEPLAFSKDSFNINSEEQSLFEKINKKRQSSNLNTLVRDSILDSVADSLAKDLVLGKITAEELYSANFLNRKLIEKNVFFAGAYPLGDDYYPGSMKDVSSEILEYFAGEESLRKALLFKDYSALGIGSYCFENKTFECVTLLILTQNNLLFNESLRKGYLKLNDLYYYLPSAMTLEKTVTITFTSSPKIATVYLVKSPEDYEKIRSRGSVNEVFKEKSSNFTRTALIKPGYSIVIAADDDNIDYQLNVKW